MNMPSESAAHKLTPHQILAFTFGTVFVTAIFVVAFAMPNPTPFSYWVFRVILALAAAGIVVVIPGLFKLNIGKTLTASGALAVFASLYFFSSASLTGVNVQTAADVEIAKPMVQAAPPQGAFDRLAQWFRTPAALPDLMVTRSDQLLSPGVLDQRYGTVTVNGVIAQVPVNATIVANEVLGRAHGSLKGTKFSVVARRLSNLEVDGRFSGSHATTTNVHFFVKVMENSHVNLRGFPGRKGDDGGPGDPGHDGAPGKHGNCGGFGAYVGARSGEDGGNGGKGKNGKRGSDGSPGGNFTLMTVINPIASVYVVSGGSAGLPGAQGSPGRVGRGGPGGDGCTGLGGSQPSRAAGSDGLLGDPGHPGELALEGREGESRLLIVPAFDKVEQLLLKLPNKLLHNALAAY